MEASTRSLGLFFWIESLVILSPDASLACLNCLNENHRSAVSQDLFQGWPHTRCLGT
jgi:hypothetical protein